MTGNRAHLEDYQELSKVGSVTFGGSKGSISGKEKHGYRRGTIDKTLFIKKDKKDIILVQIYVDDIIFRSTKNLCLFAISSNPKGSQQLVAANFYKGVVNPHGMQKSRTINATSTTEAEYVAASKLLLQVWICQILQEISQKRTRERMSDQEAKEIKAEAREIMPQPSTVNCKKPQLDTLGIGWQLSVQEGLELLVSSRVRLVFLFMRTRSQSRRRRQQQTLPVDPIVEQNVVPMADNRTMAQMLQAPIEGYEDAIVVPPINANNFRSLKTPSSMFLTKAFQNSTILRYFYNSLNSNDQDALDSAAGGNFLDKMPQEGLAIIESKSKVRYSRSRANDSRVSTDAPLSNSSSSNNSFDMQQIAASLEDKDESR
ncbi:hypothetical protein Tco_0852373 [Tanacetum coccineum]